MEPDTPSRPEQQQQPSPDEVRAAEEQRVSRDAPHVLALLRQGMPVNTAALARAAAVTVANEQIRTDGLHEQIGKLQVALKVPDRTVLKLSLQMFVFLRESHTRRGLPELPDFPLWLEALPGLEGRPSASLTRFLGEQHT